MLAGIQLSDAELSARVSRGLVRVEELLERELISEFAFVTEAASHLMHAGGKRFRPLFTLVAAGIGLVAVGLALSLRRTEAVADPASAAELR